MSVPEAVEIDVERSAALGVQTGPVVQRFRDYLTLTKFRLTLMVLASGLVGFWLASGSSPEWRVMVRFGLGTFLVIAGANAFNQVMERSLDRMMARTAGRPLPAGRMSVREARWAALLISAGGLGVLAWATNLLTFSLAAAAMIVYLVVYTPLKTVSHWSTFAGAVAGAIPPLMGWSAVRQELGPPAWAVFAIVFFWQFPHTWSIASAYRDDFNKAGYRVLPLIDPDGRRTRDMVIGFSLALAGVSLAPFALGVAGPLYVMGAVVGAFIFNGCAIRFGVGRTRRLAGQLMAASLFYMPLILALLLVDRRVI